MRKFLLIAVALVFAFSSCKKSDDNVAPPPQEIVTSDTSGLTGELTVYTNYVLHGTSNITNLNYANVFLYTNYDDIMTDLNNNTENLAIYRLTTAADNNVAYFGFINYGDYYVLGYKNEAGYYYEKVSIVQVRPGRKEYLNLYLDEIPPSKQGHSKAIDDLKQLPKLN